MKRIVLLSLLLLSPSLFAQSLEDAQRSLAQGQYEQALTQLNKYLGRNPQDASARFTQGLALTQLGRDDDAIRVFSDLARDFPELPEPFNNLAVLYARNGQYEKARDALESALVTHPSYATAHENLGDVYTAMATAAYNRAVVLDKNNPTLKNKLTVLAQMDQVKAGAAPQSFDFAASQPSDPVEEAAQQRIEQARQAAQAAPSPTPLDLASTQPVEDEPAPSTQPLATPSPTPTPIAAAPLPSQSVPVPAPIITSTEPVLGASAASSQLKIKKAPDQDAILAAVEAWRAGWSTQDVDAYLNAYSPNFEPATGISRAEWEAQRRSRVVRPRSILIQVVEPQVFQGTAKYARVEFTQIYESSTYSDQVRKLLEMEKIGGRWQIVAESVLN